MTLLREIRDFLILVAFLTGLVFVVAAGAATWRALFEPTPMGPSTPCTDRYPNDVEYCERAFDLMINLWLNGIDYYDIRVPNITGWPEDRAGVICGDGSRHGGFNHGIASHPDGRVKPVAWIAMCEEDLPDWVYSHEMAHAMQYCAGGRPLVEYFGPIGLGLEHGAVAQVTEAYGPDHPHYQLEVEAQSYAMTHSSGEAILDVFFYCGGDYARAR